MKEILNFITEFNIYTDIEKMSTEKDCLTKIERRILYGLYLNKHLLKGNLLQGLVMGNWSVHGELGLSKSVVKLANRSFEYYPTYDERLKHRNTSMFVMFKGQFGKQRYHGDKDPAAIRYYEAGPNKLLSKYFKYLDEKKQDFIKFMTSEAETVPKYHKQEPEYLPFYVPIGLVGDTVSFNIGALHAPILPQYKLKDLVSRQLDLVKYGKSEKIIQPFIEGCDIYEQNATDTTTGDKIFPKNDFENLLINGEGKILCVPKYSINKKNKSITLYARTPQKGFGSVPSDDQKILNSKANSLQPFNAKYKLINKVPYFKCSDTADKTLRGYNKIRSVFTKTDKSVDFDIFCKKIITLASESISFKCLYLYTDAMSKIRNDRSSIEITEDNIMRVFSIDELLLNSYNDIKRLKSIDISNKIKNLEFELFRAKIAIAIADVYHNNIDEIKKDSTKEYETISKIYNRDYLNKYPYTINEFNKILEITTIRELCNRNNNISEIDRKITIKKEELRIIPQTIIKELEALL